MAAATLLLPCVVLAGKARAQEAKTSDARPQEASFQIDAIDVAGNSLLDRLTLEAAIYPHMGPGRTAADVTAAQKDLEEAYRAKGYQSVVVEIPRQTVSSGIIRLQVVETPVGRLRVIGSNYHSLDVLKSQVPALAEGNVPNFTEAQAQITESNRLPDRQATPIVRPGAAPGTIDVDLKVTDSEPLHGSLEVNNQSSPFTTPLRLGANVRYDNLWQLGHTISATYQVAPERKSDAEVFAGSYVAPLWTTPWSLLVFGFTSNSDLATLGGVDVLGKGFDIGTRAIYQYKAFGPITQSLSFGFDYKHFLEFDRLDGGQVSAGAVSYWPLTATYTFRRQTQASTIASLALTANPRGLGNSDTGFRGKRSNSRANFVHANIDVEHTQPLPAGFQLDAHVTGQITDQPLVSSEQFSIAGSSTVRGYLEAEALGDNGVVGSFELRSPVLFHQFQGKLDDLRLFTFLDAGQAWVLKPQSGQTAEFTLYSVGFGARFRLLDHLAGDVFAGLPLKTGPTRAGGGDRAYTTFSLKADF